MVDEHAQSSLWAGPELLDDADEIVDAAEVFDHHTLDAQIVAPHLLDEFGVVAALHIDPAGPGHSGARSSQRHRSRRRPSRRLGRRTPRCDQNHGFAVDEISRAHRERLAAATPIFELHPAVLDAHDRTHIAGLRVLDHHAEFYWQFGRPGFTGVVRVARQNI